MLVEELMNELKDEDEIFPDYPDGYGSIDAYKTKPGVGSCSYLFLKRIRDLHLEGMEWVHTSKLHDIYHSEHGSHVNALVKLGKSKYLESKIVERIVDKHVGYEVYPTTIVTRVWRLTKKGLKYLNDNDIPLEERLINAKRKARRYLERKGVPYIIEDNIIAFDNLSPHANTPRVEFQLEELASKYTLWKRLYWCVDHYYLDPLGRDSAEEEEKYREAEQWLKERPELKRSVVTPIGVISVEGNVRVNHMALNGEAVCVIPGLRVHRSDVYICRLSWLNYQTDELMKLIVKSHLIEVCPSCGRKPQWGRVFYNSDWEFCPYCGANIDDMVEAYLEGDR